MTDDHWVPDDPRADGGLWDLVATIPVPAAADDFMARLSARLSAEPGDAVALCESRLAVHQGPSARTRRRHPVRLFIAASIVAAAAAILAFAVLPALRGTEIATAADMLASMNEAAGGSAHVVRLSIKEGMVEVGASASPSADAADRYARASDVTPEQLILSTAGDVRYTVTGKPKARPGMTTHDYSTVDAKRHETMRFGTEVPDAGDIVHTIERPSWGTDVYETYPYANIQALSSSLRAQLAEADPDTPVTETTYLGRPAWHADLTQHLPGTASDPDGFDFKWSVTVDKATGLLMASDNGAVPRLGKPSVKMFAFWVTRIEVDPRLPDGWQRISQAGHERIGIYDRGTRFGTPESVAERAWPTPVLIPEWVPAGYRLTDVATTYFDGMRQSPKDKSRLVYLSYHHPRKYHWVRTSIDATVQRVVARYRRGFSSFVIDVRHRGGRGVGSLLVDGEDVTLSAGCLKGGKASTSISPFSLGPTLVVRSDRSKVTISGDLTRQELIDVANSLMAYAVADRPLLPAYGD